MLTPTKFHNKITLTKTFASVSNEEVRSWSHAFLEKTDEIHQKKAFAVRSKTVTETKNGEKIKKV